MNSNEKIINRYEKAFEKIVKNNLYKDKVQINNKIYKYKFDIFTITVEDMELFYSLTVSISYVSKENENKDYIIFNCGEINIQDLEFKYKAFNKLESLINKIEQEIEKELLARDLENQKIQNLKNQEDLNFKNEKNLIEEYIKKKYF